MYSCLIIGLGNVGMGYDLNSNSIQSHSKAVNFHKKFVLSGAIEINKKKRQLFEKKYKKPTYTSIKSTFKLLKPQVIIISSYSQNHLHVLKEIFYYHKPKIIICEKPLGSNFDESRKIIKICRKNNSKLFVNYVRLSDPGVIRIKNKINSKKIKTPVSGTVYYNRGTLNNASHFLNMLQFWFGKVRNSQLIDKGERFSNSDFNSTFVISFEKANFIFQPTKQEITNTNFVEIFAKNGRLLYKNGGQSIIWQKLKKNQNSFPKFYKKNYKLFSGKKKSQLYFLNNLYYALNKKNSSICTGQKAIKTLKILYSLYEK
ncbi:Gfo/Idh/MocA family oxidoreductase [Candidatus Pelagibacter ubique]|nr:Gfo/Idh/MocA family oxidoreductase [Candidatus Pelagibacter ubique]